MVKLSVMSATVLHDKNGNITSWGSTSYTRNAKNQLIAISGPSLTASFKYDAVGRRVEKTINGTTTKHLYDGADIIMEMTSSGTPTVFYVRTLNIDEPLARIDLSTGDIRYYHADALGSIIALTDENGTVKTQYNYSPFGQTEVIGEASDNPFMFTGREWDGATGLYYFRNRYQSPILGRFISEDPIGLAGGINFYSYVGNSPLNFTDPWGLASYEALVNLHGGGAIAGGLVMWGPVRTECVDGKYQQGVLLVGFVGADVGIPVQSTAFNLSLSDNAHGRGDLRNLEGFGRIFSVSYSFVRGKSFSNIMLGKAKSTGLSKQWGLDVGAVGMPGYCKVLAIREHTCK